MQARWKDNLARAALAVAACFELGAAAPESTLTLTSPAFGNGAPIPAAYTCTGGGSSPPLAWTAPPARTQSIALLVTDLDASVSSERRPFVHWLIYNLPPTERALPAGLRDAKNGAVQGPNDFGRNGYGGPCPPNGRHRYMFHLYALDARLVGKAPAKFSDFVKAIDGHVLANGELEGTYEKSGGR